MLNKIDWISFSIDNINGEGRALHEMPKAIITSLEFLDHRLFDILAIESDSETIKPRSPYSMGWRFPDVHISIFANPKLTHALVEISGKGCDRMERLEIQSTLLSIVLNRLTRLDIASDILSETRPVEFALMRDIGRFKSHSDISSPSGDTYYVGSMSSDRFARVYRYNPPHERAHLMRVEVVLRGMNARLAAQGVLERGLDYVVAALGRVFGWSHADWKPFVSDADTLKAYRPERHIGKTEYWLAAQVAPVLIRLHREGILDANEWFASYIGKEIDRE